jgi:hypothetical protein
VGTVNGQGHLYDATGKLYRVYNNKGEFIDAQGRHIATIVNGEWVPAPGAPTVVIGGGVVNNWLARMRGDFPQEAPPKYIPAVDEKGDVIPESLQETERPTAGTKVRVKETGEIAVANVKGHIVNRDGKVVATVSNEGVATHYEVSRNAPLDKLVDKWFGDDSIPTASGKTEPTFTDTIIDKVWGKVETKADKEGWFSGIGGKISLVFWLIVSAIGLFVCVCILGMLARMASIVGSIFGIKK